MGVQRYLQCAMCTQNLIFLPVLNGLSPDLLHGDMVRSTSEGNLHHGIPISIYALQIQMGSYTCSICSVRYLPFIVRTVRIPASLVHQEEVDIVTFVDAEVGRISSGCDF